MTDRMKVGVLVSGSGTDLQSVIDAGINVVRVISSKEGVYALERAAKAGIPSSSVTAGDYPDIKERMTAIADILEKDGVELVVLAGYLSILTKELLDRFPGRVINIHPALLPKFGGKGFYGLNVHKAVLDAGEKESGATVHFVNEGVDEGEIIMQVKVPVMEDDTPESLQARVLEKEHELLPAAILKLEEEKLKEEREQAK